MIFGRTELIINVSRAKFVVEADGEVYLIPNRQNLTKNEKNFFFGPNFLASIFFSALKHETSGIVFPKFGGHTGHV